MINHIKEIQLKKLIEHQRTYQNEGNQQAGKATYDLGEDYTDLLTRIAILRRTSKTQTIRDLLNQEAHELGGAEVLYPRLRYCGECVGGMVLEDEDWTNPDEEVWIECEDCDGTQYKI
jgi:hypothetical protein